MNRLGKLLDQDRLAPTLVLISMAALSSWMGVALGGYFVTEWAPVALILAALVLLASLTGVLLIASSRWAAVALGFFTAYTMWTFASILWSPDKGSAWLGAGQTLLYLLTFTLTVAFISLGASRRAVLTATVLGPAIVAALTLLALVPRTQTLFGSGRLVGTVDYFNGEAAFLLVPFWVAIYLAGSRDINWVLRAAILTGATLSVELAVLAQSRGAMVSMAISLPVFFLLSSQRLRGLIALIPVALALLIAFPGLNQVYLTYQNQGDLGMALVRALPAVWLTAAGAGLYGLIWSFIDRRWSPPAALARLAANVMLAVTVILIIFGGVTVTARTGNPIAALNQKWTAFKTDNVSGEGQSRYLSASGSGRYILWQVAWEDFTSHPMVGIGTQNYEATFYQLRQQPFGSVRQPHMLTLEVLAERGIVGGVLFFGFLAISVGTGLRKRFGDLNSQGKAQVGALTAAVTYWFVHSNAEWFWQIPAVTLPAVMYLGMLAAPWRRRRAHSTGGAARGIGAVAAVLAMAALTPLYISGYYLSKSYSTGDVSSALLDVQRAQRFNPLDPKIPEREADLAMQTGDWPLVESAYRREIQLNPDHYAPYMYMAAFYEKRLELDKALSYYQQALGRNPLDPGLKQKVDHLSAQK